MEYKQISILPNASNNEFILSIKSLVGDRVEKEPAITYNTLTYPISMSDAEAFKSLKDYLLKEHDDNILNLSKSKEKLIAVELLHE